MIFGFECLSKQSQRQRQIEDESADDGTYPQDTDHQSDHSPTSDGESARDGTDGCPCASDQESQRRALAHPRVQERPNQRQGSLGVDIERQPQCSGQGTLYMLPPPNTVATQLAGIKPFKK